MKTRTISIGIVGVLVIGGFVGLFSEFNQVSASGPTFVSGSITSDTTWELANSPYIVVGDVTIESGASLTIEPGVEVKFDGIYSIIVDGTLHAIGNSVNKITFTSNKTTPAKGDWYTIRLRTENNFIEYVEIEYATYGVFMTFYGANNKISNATVKYCKFDGIYITNSDDNIISDCTITSNDRYGITIYDSDNTEVKNNIIQYNSYFGINLNASTFSQISNCNISYNDGKGILLYSDSEYTTISDCEIDYNDNIGIDLSGTSNNNITDTRVSGNNGIGIDFGGVTTNQWIENCTIINNEGTGIDLRGSSYVDIIACNVSRNKGKGGIYSKSGVIYITIKNTDVWNNLAGNGIDFYNSKFINIDMSNIIGNEGNGIYFTSSESTKNNIKYSTINSNKENGIYFNGDQDHSNVYENTILSNGANGIFFNLDQHYNYVYNNNISLNSENGIYFYRHIKTNNEIFNNMIISNGQDGISLNSGSMQNNKIHDNTVIDNMGNGISLKFEFGGGGTQNHNEIYENIVKQNYKSGIYLYCYYYFSRQENNSIFKNIIEANDQNGISIRRSDGIHENNQQINVYNNSISNNRKNGIYLEDTFTNNLRYNCIQNNNWTGISLNFSSSNNNIENNQIVSNSMNGISITNNSNSNLITNNNISINLEIGLNITNSTGNQIHHNNFKENTQNAYDSTIALNDWDDGAEGNYWHDYAGFDDNGDGFGEDPYVIPSGGSRDWHPYINFLDNTPPFLISTFPLNEEINISIETTISLTFSKKMNTTAVESAITISDDVTPHNFIWGAKNKTVTFNPSSNLASKTVYTVIINIEAKDTFGNSMSSPYSFCFMTEEEQTEPSNHAPIVNVLKPNGDIADESFTIQWSASDQDEDPLTITLYYDIDKNPNNGMILIESGVANTGLCVWDTSRLNERDYYVYVIANDSAEEVGTYSQQLTIDHPDDIDTDGDGKPNGDADNSEPWMDTDDDNDGYADENDDFPLNALEWLDTDEDGIGNNADLDDDNDGYFDNQDAEPLNPDVWKSSEEGTMGIWLPLLALIIICIIIIIYAILKKVIKSKGNLEPEDENPSFKNRMDDSQEIISQSELEVPPPPPPTPKKISK